MPIYEFTCATCGLRFDRLSKMSDSQLRQVPCKSCGAESFREVSAANHTFSHGDRFVRGAAPPNTGTSDDWNYDRIIGRDAEQKWKLFQDRVKHKQDILRQNPGAEGADLSRTMDGSYRVMDKAERTTVEQARAVGIQHAPPAKIT